MSRIGLKPIELGQGVEVKVNGNVVEVKGPKGTLTQAIDPSMTVTVEDGVLTIARPDETKQSKALHGLSRSLIHNMVVGVSEGFQKELEITGTGYRAAKQGKTLVLNLGYSHPIELPDPEGIEVEVPDPNKIIVKGMDRQAVGQHAAIIRGYREPEPYKGKGIRYADEYVRRKAGKTGK